MRSQECGGLESGVRFTYRITANETENRVKALGRGTAPATTPVAGMPRAIGAVPLRSRPTQSLRSPMSRPWPVGIPRRDTTRLT